MENNGYLLMIGGLFAAFMQWMFLDVHWAIGGVWKTMMSLFYGGVGACGAYFTRKYIIVHVEKHGSFWKWMKVLFRLAKVTWKKRKGSDGAKPPKQ